MVWEELQDPKPVSSEPGSAAAKGKGKARKTKQMEALAEEEEDEQDEEGSTRRRRRGEEETDGGDGSRRPSWTTEDEERKRPREKVPPPIPSLKAGDETVSGATEALVDEIATALREWYSVSILSSPFFSIPSFQSTRPKANSLPRVCSGCSPTCSLEITVSSTSFVNTSPPSMSAVGIYSTRISERRN